MVIAMVRNYSFHVVPLLLLGLCFNVVGENAEDNGAKVIAELTFHILQNSTLDEKKNFVMSTASIYSVLNILLSGTGGKSASEIKSFLGPDPPSVYNKYASVLKHSKTPHGERILNSIHQIFYKKGIKINSTFRENAEKNFEARFSEVDPANKTVTGIAHWLKNNLNMTLDGGDISDDSDLVVVDMMKFQDNWEEKFDSQDTTDGYFFQSSENRMNVDYLVKKNMKMVSGKNEELGAKWIHIPYDTIFQMVLVLPLKRFGLADLLKQMSFDNFMEILNADEVHSTSFAVPKFDAESSFEVQKRLKKLGVKEIFTNKANLTGISDSLGPLKVDKIVQSCRMRIDEKGTTAAAMTAGSLDFHRGSLGIPTHAFFIADEPFLFFIIIEGIPIFSGVIVQPKDNIN